MPVAGAWATTDKKAATRLSPQRAKGDRRNAMDIRGLYFFGAWVLLYALAALVAIIQVRLGKLADKHRKPMERVERFSAEDNAQMRLEKLRAHVCWVPMPVTLVACTIVGGLRSGPLGAVSGLILGAFLAPVVSALAVDVAFPIITKAKANARQIQPRI